jgi:hybrid cluster-associated redox disulfide protein
MDRPIRLFIFASLSYLAAGAVLGLLLVMAPVGMADLLFSHVHLLLAGFMAMMVFGVGYFILPRFAARSLRWPGMVEVHFWLANVSLLAMVIGRPVEAAGGADLWGTVFRLGAVVQVVSVLMFSVNLGLTLAARSKPAEPAGAPGLRMAGKAGGPAPGFGPDTPVATFVDRKEGALEVLVSAGLTPIRDPGHLAMVRRAGIPLATACAKHGLDLSALLPRLQALPDKQPDPAAAGITPDHVIGQMVRNHPATREVLRKKFGEGCFTCPGFETETLAQGAMMHGVDVAELISDLKQAISEG